MPRARILLFLFAFPLSGCTAIGYYTHVIGGQLDILGRANSIAELLARAPDTNGLQRNFTPEVRGRLETVLRIRTFASAELALPDNGSYRDYVELDREAVAWNVIAAPEFSMKLERWCYPIAGCVSYRGFFAHQRAQAFADTLRRNGMDVRIARVSAYSTLGWFRDPVLSTQLKQNEADLAALLFHELAHQQLYVPDDTAFNESFATVVAQQGLRRWLAREGRAGAYEAWLAEYTQHAQFVGLLREYRLRLEQLYASGMPPDVLRREKAAVFTDLHRAYQERRRQWHDRQRYDSWFSQNLNNAHLAGVDLYHRYVPAFETLFHDAGSDFTMFYRSARAIGHLPAGERRARLAQLAGRAAAAR